MALEDISSELDAIRNILDHLYRKGLGLSYGAIPPESGPTYGISPDKLGVSLRLDESGNVMTLTSETTAGEGARIIGPTSKEDKRNAKPEKVA